MLENLIGTRVGGRGENPERWSPQGRQVRMVVMTWPLVALLGGTVATATGLLKDCGRTGRPAVTETLVGNVGAVRSISLRGDGEMLASVGVGGSMVVFDMTTRPRYPYMTAETGSVRCAEFSPEGRVLATASPAEVVAIHDLVGSESQPLVDSSGASKGAACLAFSPDGATLAVGQQDGKVTLWDVATRRQKSVLAGHAEFVASLAFAPDGTALASAGGDRTVRVWNLSTCQQRFAITSPANTFVALAISPDSRLLCLADQVNPFVRLWDMASGHEAPRLRGPAGAVVAVGISPDGSTLAAADYQGVVTFWDLAPRTLRSMRVKHPGVHALAFAADGVSLVTGGFDGTIRFWDLSGSRGD